MSQKFYVTTPIYYPTAKPHLGSLYTTVLADVAARWHKLLGAQVCFLTGTDEHGQKIAQAAAQAGVSPQQFVDQLVGEYTGMWHKYGIAYDRFIRTTDPAHVRAVQTWLAQLMARDLIYKAEYVGYYCTPCETFVTETAAKAASADQQSRLAVTTPFCPSCQRETSYLAEENYFFRLSQFQEQLLTFYAQHPDFITPKERLNEVISFVSAGLKDLCLSRSTVTWGIKFPGDERHVTYVWADALNNYLSGVGYADPARQTEFQTYWPADLQVMGKDIVRFHAVYWPAFLMASTLPLPKQLLVHGWIKVQDQKMSKSLGNVIDPAELLTIYGADAVRYYLVSQLAITRDADFSIADLEQKLSSDLANDLGNLLNRTVQLAAQQNCLTLAPVTTWPASMQQLQEQVRTLSANYAKYMQANCAYLALSELWKVVKLANAFFHEQQPWVLAKQDRGQFQLVLLATAHILRLVAILAWPVLPGKMTELLQRLGHDLQPTRGVDLVAQLQTQPWDLAFQLTPGAPLFSRYDQKPA
ncbi:MAG TPA: methionine--tRNA ligase, partial [Candidatus Babeliales bacterium]|nr:methionine--tRNA ligase [Candidatus Babeliales bacterium]